MAGTGGERKKRRPPTIVARHFLTASSPAAASNSVVQAAARDGGGDAGKAPPASGHPPPAAPLVPARPSTLAPARIRLCASAAPKSAPFSPPFPDKLLLLAAAGAAADDSDAASRGALRADSCAGNEVRGDTPCRRFVSAARGEDTEAGGASLLSGRFVRKFSSWGEGRELGE